LNNKKSSGVLSADYIDREDGALDDG